MREQVPIRRETIRLGQLLKLAGLLDAGGEAKVLLARDEVSVNGELERRRGRQLRAGDTVSVGRRELEVVTAPRGSS